MPKPSIEFDALGTHWWIELLGAWDEGDIADKIRVRVTKFENDYSRFLPNSFLGQLNTNKYLMNPTGEFLEMLEFARDIYNASSGIFNISVGGTLVEFGYGKGKPGSQLDTSLWDKITMNQDEIRIPDDAELDFGGFGKGWLIDDLGRLLRDEGYDQFVINGGGDILVSSPSPIEFALEHPTDSTKKIGTTRISQGALAVSSSVKRAWKQGDKSYHHIIDPRLGGSSDSVIISTYVKADSALIADTMATLLLIAPEQDETLRQQFSLETILLNQRQLKS